MSHVQLSAERATPRPLPENIRGVQPGGGACHRIELAWGRWRRWWLKTFRRGYVERMAAARHGTTDGAPHEVLDPRDLKYCRNLCECRWDAAEDPFRWREKIPFARWGLAELLLLGGPLLAATAALALLPAPYWAAALVPGVLLALVVYFFRDPPRRVPRGKGLIISPADGTVVDVAELDHEEFIGGRAVRIGIFLSLLNVHVNRAPARLRIIELRYSPGKFLNAMKPESSRENENMWIAVEQPSPPFRRMVMRQISGMVARRIVCDLRPGQVVEAGQRFGMIKLGSRTELFLPAEDTLAVEVRIGQKVAGGRTILARYVPACATPDAGDSP